MAQILQGLSYALPYYHNVPDQIGTLSQVGTKKISKGGWTI